MFQGSVLPGKAVGLAAEVSRKLGFYRQARAVYRTLDPGVRNRVAREQAFYRPFVTPGALVFDIGANKGQKTEVFRLLGARVVAVEPNPRALEILRALVHADPGAEVVEAAVGASPGRAVLHTRGTASTASLRSDWRFFDYGRGTPVDVEVVTLDALVARFGAPDFCKIDVEGFELETVRGLSRPLPCLSLEFHLDELDRLYACLDHLESLGPVTLNAIEMEGHALLFPDWLPPRAFRDAIAAAGVGEGDVFIRAAST
jgi:FkbM family methyltransferase